jgi:hypothetical protein
MAPRDVVVSSLNRKSFGRAPTGCSTFAQDDQIGAQNHAGATLRPRPPSRRFAAVHMGPITFLWLLGGWVAAVALLLAGVLVVRHLV